MRSFAFALCLAVSASGVAVASPFTMNPIRLFHHGSSTSAQARVKPQMVSVCFRNGTFHNLKLQAGQDVYLLRAQSSLRLSLPVGMTVQRIDDMDSRRDRELILEVSGSDWDRLVQVG